MRTRQWPDRYCTLTNSYIMHFTSLPNPLLIVHDSPSMLPSKPHERENENYWVYKIVHRVYVDTVCTVGTVCIIVFFDVRDTRKATALHWYKTCVVST
jgi:magnesium-transporting ATPase (P-type)